MQVIRTRGNENSQESHQFERIEFEWLDDWIQACGKTKAVAIMIISGIIGSSLFFGTALYIWKEVNPFETTKKVYALTYFCILCTIGTTIFLGSMLSAIILNNRQIRPLQ